MPHNGARVDDGMDEPRLAREHDRNGQDAFLESVASEVLDEGRVERSRAGGEGCGLRLRRRHIAHPSGADRRGVSRGLQELFLPQRDGGCGRENHRATVGNARTDLWEEVSLPRCGGRTSL